MPAVDLEALDTADLLALRADLAKYSDDEPRDERGEWTSDGGSFAEHFDALRTANRAEIAAYVEQHTGTTVSFTQTDNYGKPLPDVLPKMVQFRQAMAKFCALHDQFPGVKVAAIVFDKPSSYEKPYLAITQTNPWKGTTDSIRLNPVFWRSGGRGFETGLSKGWLAAGTSAESIMTHEFGHAVDAAAQHATGQMTVYPDTPAAWRNNAFISAPAISGYGAVVDPEGRTNEKFAELFAAVYAGGNPPADQKAGLEGYLAAAFAPTKVLKYSEDEPRDDHGMWTSGGGMDGAADRAGLGVDDAVRQRFSPEAQRGVASAINRVNAAFPGSLKGVNLFTKSQDEMNANFGRGTAGATSPDGRTIMVSDRAGTSVPGMYDPKGDHSFGVGGDTTEGVVLHELCHAVLDAGHGWALHEAPWSAYDMAKGMPPVSGYASLDNGNGKERATELLASALLGQGSADAERLSAAVGRRWAGKLLKYSDDQPRDDHGRWTSDAVSEWVGHGGAHDIRYALSSGTREAHRMGLTADWQHGATLLGAIERAPRMAVPLYRGLQLPPGAADREFRVGKTVDLNLSSWSSDKVVASQFAGMTQQDRFGNPIEKGTESVRLELAPGARALDISGQSPYGGEAEHITAGRFMVTGVSDVWGGRAVSLEQVGAFNGPVQARGSKVADLTKYSDDQPRDDHGRFTSGDVGSSTATFTEAQQTAAADYMMDTENVRTIQENPQSQEAQDLAAGLRNCPPVDGVVYRGLSDHGLDAGADRALWEGRVGQTVAMHDPMSTTKDTSVASAFGNVMLAIDQQGAARDIIAMRDKETRDFAHGPMGWNEQVLAPGRFRVDGVTTEHVSEGKGYGGVETFKDMTVVHLTDITTGDRQWYSDRSGSGARTTTVTKGVGIGDTRRFCGQEGGPGGYEMEVAVKYSDDEPRDDAGRWTDGGGSGPAVATGNSVREIAANMGANALSVNQENRPDLYMVHPKSGFMVRNDTPAPMIVPPTGGPPRIAQSVPAGPFRQDSLVPGSERPPDYVYRAVSEAEWKQAQDRGYLQSDGRQNLSQSEGTVSSLHDPSWYLPGNSWSSGEGDHTGYLLRIKYDDSDGWRHDPADGYVKTDQQIPVGRVDMVSPPITTTTHIEGSLEGGGALTTDVRVGKGVIAKYSEDEPRDERGQWTSDGSSGDKATISTHALELNDAHPGTLYYAPMLNTMSAASTVAAIDRIGQMQDKFPAMRLGEVSADHLSPSRIAETAFNLTGGGLPDTARITLNADRFSGAWSSGTSAGWLADPTPEGVGAHEFGHVVQHDLNDRTTNDPSNPVRAWMDSLWTKPVSGYSESKPSEAFAEQFSAAYSKGPAADTPASETMRQMLSGIYGPAALQKMLLGLDVDRLLAFRTLLLKYSEDQPRDDHGRWTAGDAVDDPGGRWSGEKFPPNGSGHTVGRFGGDWGYSHGDSSAITGAAARAMGIEGYKYEDGKWAQRTADKFLSAIAGDHLGSEEPLYHGFRDTKFIDWKVGDTLKLPLTATSGDANDSVGYANPHPPGQEEADRARYGYGPTPGATTLFEFPQGTPMAGYSRWNTADQKNFGYIWSEAVVAGEYRVTGVRDITTNYGWWNAPAKVVSLEPTQTFNPKDGSWSATQTQLLHG